MDRKTTLVICLAFAAASCGDDGTQGQNDEDTGIFRSEMDASTTNASDAGRDAASSEDVSAVDSNSGTRDTGDRPDVPPSVRCGEAAAVGTTIAIDEGDLGGQLYARTAWDGAGAWVVYNRPTTEGGPEHVFAARVACDGTVEVGPIEVSDPTSSDRNYMTAIDSRNGTTHLAWVTQPEGTNAKAIHYRPLDRSGEPLADAAYDVTPTGPLDPVSDLVWEVDIAATPDGAAIAASAGTAGALNVVVQRFGTDGARDGEAFFPHGEKDVHQQRPSIASGDDGTLYLAWTRSRDADPENGIDAQPETVVHTSVPAGATEAFPTSPSPAKPLSTPNPMGRLAKTPGPGGEMFLAFQVSTNSSWDILVRDGSDFESAETITFGTDGFANYRPSMAGGVNRGVVAWYRFTESPQKAQVMLQDVVPGGGGLAGGDEVVVTMGQVGVPPYGPGVTHVEDDLYFVVWSEGETASEARAKGRFVRF